MSKERLLSLDAFRGLTIAGMIVVNNPGSWAHVYAPLLHSKWEGCTPTDLVFPFFLFIVGVSMWFSFKAYDYKLSKASVFKIITRSLVIFAIGCFLNAFPFIDFKFETFRIMGVLQRIAIAYALASMLCLLLGRKNLILSTIIILISYFLILFSGGGSDPFSLAGNVTNRIDLFILGEKHLYTGFGIPFDPEGLLSTIPAVATVILGFLTGNYLDKAENKEAVLLRLTLIGSLLVFSGIVISYAMPIIKALWTSTYVIYTAGLAMIMLSFFIFLVDIKGWKKMAQPFIVFGSNPLFIYALSGILGTLLYIIPVGETSVKEYVYNHYLIHIFGYRSGSLLGALLLTGICWVVAWLLYRKRVYIKI
jgi:predicted acyltransferase